MAERKNVLHKIGGKLKSPFAIFFYKKLGFLLGAFFLGMTLLFVISQLMPSSPAEIMVSKVLGNVSGNPFSGGGGGISGQGQYHILAEIYKEKFGVTGSLFTKYKLFWMRFLEMDFGKSVWRYPYKVSTLLANRLPWTLALIIPVLPVGFVIGNWIGSRAAYYGDKKSNFFYWISMYFNQSPLFIYGLILMVLLGVELGLFPTHLAYSDKWLEPVMNIRWFASALYHYILPFLTLVGLGIGGWAVGMRAMTVYEMESDYMQYSKQLGFSKGKLRNYAEHNAILPNFTQIPLVFNSLIGQTLIVEFIFDYPGVGTLAYNAAASSDWPLLEATFIVTMLIVLIGNFICDILYGVLDPRIATGYIGGE